MSINQIQSVFLLRVQKIGVDIAENEPPKVFTKWGSQSGVAPVISSVFRSSLSQRLFRKNSVYRIGFVWAQPLRIGYTLGIRYDVKRKQWCFHTCPFRGHPDWILKQMLRFIREANAWLTELMLDSIDARGAKKDTPAGVACGKAAAKHRLYCVYCSHG